MYVVIMCIHVQCIYYIIYMYAYMYSCTYVYMTCPINSAALWDAVLAWLQIHRPRLQKPACFRVASGEDQPAAASNSQSSRRQPPSSRHWDKLPLWTGLTCTTTSRTKTAGTGQTLPSNKMCF